MIQALVERGVVKFGEFTLSSGLKSPFYVDLRGVLGHPDLLRWVVSRYLSILVRLDFDVVVGVATGGIPYASIVGYLLGSPVGYVRPEAKGYGTGRQVEGVDVAGKKVVVLDDVVPTGKNVIAAVDALRVAGGQVVGVVVFLDREQCGVENIKSSTGVEVYSVFKMRELLERLRPYVHESHYRSAMEYLAQWRC